MTDPGEPMADAQAAARWAVSVRHDGAMEVVHRRRRGGDGFSADELTAIVADWERAGRPPPEVHVHRTPVTFENGAVVTGVTFAADDPYARSSAPGFGLYLDERWSPPWPHDHVDWPDFGLPADSDALRRDLLGLLDRAGQGEAVELGCLGGHGRTGTALACLAVLTGTPPSQAVAWVRANYCSHAVETEQQEAFVASFAGLDG